MDLIQNLVLPDAGVVSITRGQSELVCLKLRKLTAVTAKALTALHSPALTKVDLWASLFTTDGTWLHAQSLINLAPKV